MARLNVNPTRMEMGKLKVRLKTARRGHKLLKDKCDELIRQFLNIVKNAREQRIKCESKLFDVTNNFEHASEKMGSREMMRSLALPNSSIDIETYNDKIFGVEVPKFNIKSEISKGYPYSEWGTARELDRAIDALNDNIIDLIKLAEFEKAAQLLAIEIERTRRRVNALEHVLIPDLAETIKYIAMKLEENERGNITRLMKLKDIK